MSVDHSVEFVVARDYRFGWNLVREVGASELFALPLKVVRRESADDERKHALGIRLNFDFWVRIPACQARITALRSRDSSLKMSRRSRRAKRAIRRHSLSGNGQAERKAQRSFLYASRRR